MVVAVAVGVLPAGRSFVFFGIFFCHSTTIRVVPRKVLFFLEGGFCWCLLVNGILLGTYQSSMASPIIFGFSIAGFTIFTGCHHLWGLVGSTASRMAGEYQVLVPGPFLLLV